MEKNYAAIVKKEMEEAATVLQNFMADPVQFGKIAEAATLIARSFQAGGKVISFGNGGSQCDAMHFAEELSGRYRENRPAYPAIAISDPGHLTCVSNDYGYAHVFSRFIEGLGKPGDVVLGISTSGNSENVVKAFEICRQKQITTILLSGKDGGKLAPLADLEIRVPHFGYADRIQEVHIKIIHTLILLIEDMMAQ